ncbi:MAG: DNA-binding response regulator [Gammaproteobacteria bacterium]|nr:MAG: DNA-binding response regulator [Gammaproteobacteria bacterium]
MSAITVGLLEDEAPQAQMMITWLEEAGYDVVHGSSGEQFLSLVRERRPELLILDWQLPDCEGIDVLQELRTHHDFTGPVVFATAKDSEDDIVRGLVSGADDYLVKPLRRAELLARLSALWRRVAPEKPQAVVQLGEIELDQDNCIARNGGEEVRLTPTEFRLASYVLRNVGKLLSREQLLKEVWGVQAEIDTRTVDMHMSRIRKALQIGPSMGYMIKTVYRHGYRLEKLEHE